MDLNGADIAIPVILGRRPQPHETEHLKRNVYDSGQADLEAAKVAGPSDEPWLNVIAAYERGSMPVLDWIFSRSDLRQRIRGQILDAGAGRCRPTAELLKWRRSIGFTPWIFQRGSWQVQARG